jgi:hypothetical protein
MTHERGPGTKIATECGPCRAGARMAHIEAPRTADDRAKPSAGLSDTTAPTGPGLRSPSSPGEAPAR